MRLSFLLAVLLIIMLFLISESVITVHAKTLTIDCGETTSRYADSYIKWSFNVKMIVQTEQNDIWIVNNSYEVDWVIKLTYLNESIYDRDSFSIVCYNPQNYLSDNILQNCTIYETAVTPPKDTGTLSAKFTPIATINYELDTAFGLKVFDKARIRGSGYWWQNEPIPISIVEQSNNDDGITPHDITDVFLWVGIVAIGAIIIGIAIGIWLKVKNNSPA